VGFEAGRGNSVERVLVIDDHPMVADMIALLARQVFTHADLLIADTLGAALEHVRRPQRIDLALLDLGLPDCSGIQSLVVFRQAAPAVRVVVVSLTDDSATIQRALHAGAAGYVPKTHPAPLISAALRFVANGGTYVPPQALRPSAAEEPLAQEHPFTPRQCDVMRLIVRGLANKQIAEQLKIAEDTVKQHARAAYLVLGVSSRTQAVTTLARRGIALD
jgi:DNA-binding NarL/FixJ family response regulator